MQRVMHNNAGVYRSGKFLKDGCDQMSQLADDMEKNLKVYLDQLCIGMHAISLTHTQVEESFKATINICMTVYC